MLLAIPLAFGGAYFFGFWGFVIGIVAAVVASAFTAKNKVSQPPEVKVVNQRESIKHDSTNEIRLAQLKQLFERKLIDAGEYDRKRGDILRSMGL